MLAPASCLDGNYHEVHTEMRCLPSPCRSHCMFSPFGLAVQHGFMSACCGVAAQSQHVVQYLACLLVCWLAAVNLSSIHSTHELHGGAEFCYTTHTAQVQAWHTNHRKSMGFPRQELFTAFRDINATEMGQIKTYSNNISRCANGTGWPHLGKSHHPQKEELEELRPHPMHAQIGCQHHRHTPIKQIKHRERERQGKNGVNTTVTPSQGSAQMDAGTCSQPLHASCTRGSRHSHGKHSTRQGTIQATLMQAGGGPDEGAKAAYTKNKQGSLHPE